MKLLLVEDEDAIAEPLAEGLRREGFEVERVATAAAALDAAEPDLVLLDVGLPDTDGFTLCRELRGRSEVPIIMVTAKGEEIDRVVGLEVGADDYIVKPFGFRELIARIRAVTRRQHGTATPAAVEVGPLVVDTRSRRVTLDGRELVLTPKEFDLLALLARNPDRVLTHRTILKAIWGPNAVDQPEHLWALVAQLRRKLEADPAHPRYVVTEPWVGYRLQTEAADV
jgi:DNA-binding response OmpR family regulator